jgi:hypothetical protein
MSERDLLRGANLWVPFHFQLLPHLLLQFQLPLSFLFCPRLSSLSSLLPGAQFLQPPVMIPLFLLRPPTSVCDVAGTGSSCALRRQKFLCLRFLIFSRFCGFQAFQLSLGFPDLGLPRCIVFLFFPDALHCFSQLCLKFHCLRLFRFSGFFFLPCFGFPEFDLLRVPLLLFLYADVPAGSRANKRGRERRHHDEPD